MPCRLELQQGGRDAGFLAIDAGVISPYSDSPIISTDWLIPPPVLSGTTAPPTRRSTCVAAATLELALVALVA